MVGCAGLLAAVQILAVRFADLRYFFPQLGDAPTHGDRLAEHVASVRSASEWIANENLTAYGSKHRQLRALGKLPLE